MGELEYDFIYTKYWLEDPGWSTIDLAKYYNTYSTKIVRFMHKHNIPLRGPKEMSINTFKCPSKLETLRESFKKEERNKKISFGLKEYIKKHPEYKKEKFKQLHSKESLKKRKNTMKDKFKDPNYRMRILENIKKTKEVIKY